MQAFVLCAGEGTRLRPLTKVLPKPLFPLLGKPVLAAILDKLKREGFSRIAINAYHLKDELKKFVSLYSRKKGILVEVFEEPELLGTCGALKFAESFFSEPTLVINGDIVTNFSLRTVYEAFLRQKDTGCLMFLHRVKGLNRVRVEDGFVVGFGKDSPEGYAYTGIQVVDPEWIRILPEEKDLVVAYERLLSEGARIRALVASGFYWRDVGNWNDYLKCVGELERGEVFLPELSGGSSRGLKESRT